MFLSHFMQRLSLYCLPIHCALCNQPTRCASRLCQDCHKDLPIVPKHCPQCGLFLTHNNSLSIKCGACIKNTPPFERTFSLFPYQPPISQMIAQLKFHQQLAYASVFTELLSQSIINDWYASEALPSILIPIPLHSSRLRERGFNQAVEIAKPLAKKLGMTLDLAGTQRIRPTRAQSGLKASARKANIAGAFKTKKNYTDQHVAVLDDVVTTGHTVSTFCQLLKRHHATRIDIWCVARRG